MLRKKCIWRYLVHGPGPGMGVLIYVSALWQDRVPWRWLLGVGLVQMMSNNYNNKIFYTQSLKKEKKTPNFQTNCLSFTKWTVQVFKLSLNSRWGFICLGVMIFRCQLKTLAVVIRLLMYWTMSGVDSKPCPVYKIYLVLKTY